jgi:hypothetical protein
MFIFSKMTVKTSDPSLLLTRWYKFILEYWTWINMFLQRNFILLFKKYLWWNHHAWPKALLQSNCEKLLNRTAMACALRSRIDKCVLMKLQSFCKAKDTINKRKRPPTDWERIFTYFKSDRGLISNIYKEIAFLNCSILTMKSLWSLSKFKRC